MPLFLRFFKGVIMEYQSLINEFEKNVQLSIKLMLDCLNAGNKEIFAYAVNILDDLSDIAYFANSIDNINSKYKWFSYEFNIDYLDIKKYCETEFLEIKKLFDSITNILETVGDNYFDFFAGEDDEDYIKVKNDLIDAVIRAIKKAKDETEMNTKKIVFFVSMPSADDDLDIALSSAQALNDESILNDFLKTYIN